jgi:ABC-2 type transport system ATP-binding protein
MIQVQQLTKAYGQRTAIRELNFTVAKGEIVGFLGPNGAGKSTTMKILSGFMPASSGTALVAGYDVFTSPLEVKKRVGFLPETPPLYLEMSVEDYVEHVARLKQVAPAEISKAVSVALEKTGLGNVRSRLIGHLSKGYKQRVGLAQALVHNPPVLILDEPTVGLDPAQIIEIREAIKGLGGEHTVILSSHILSEVNATCRRIIVIRKGEIVANDLVDRLTSLHKGGVIYRLETRKMVPDALSAIRSLAGIQRVEQRGSEVELEIDPSAAEIRDQIVSIACRHELGVLEFSARRKSLEETFLELTNEPGVSSST